MAARWLQRAPLRLAPIALGLTSTIACESPHTDISTESPTRDGGSSGSHVTMSGAGGQATPRGGAAGQTADEASAGGNNDVGGNRNDDAAGAGGVSGGSADGGAPGGGDRATDTRPECALAPSIELFGLRIEEVSNAHATLKIEVKNGTQSFVSGNPVSLVCTGDSVQSAKARTVFFGILRGMTATVTIDVTFKPQATTGDVADCTVRGAISNKTPDDCANAQTASINIPIP